MKYKRNLKLRIIIVTHDLQTEDSGQQRQDWWRAALTDSYIHRLWLSAVALTSLRIIYSSNEQNVWHTDSNSMIQQQQSKNCKTWLPRVISVLLIQYSSGKNPNGAFCKSNPTLTANFPLPLPSTYLTPWVWDAIENTKQNTVDLTIVSRRACEFNHTLWQQMKKDLPQHSKHFAYGLISNILVKSDEFTDLLADPYRRNREGLFEERLNCIYYNNGSRLTVAQTKSQPIDGDPAWLQYSTINIVCPSPAMKFDLMRIERVTIKSINGLSVIPLQSSQKDDLVHSMSDCFPVCRAVEFAKDIVNKNMDVTGRYYGIAVCTATNRINRSHMVEWLEYHKYLGVDHFFIYLTSSTTQHSTDYATLSDYVLEGTVTIVPWGYQNCVKGMASGRSCHWASNSTGNQFFKPPAAIAQSAALGSCYSRFKRFTKYMMHIDDDEFVAMNLSIARSTERKHSGQRKKFKGALYDYANQIFSRNPQAAAIHFRPVGKYHCPGIIPQVKKEITNQESNQSSTLLKSILPRIDVILVSKLEYEYESKLLMRTDAVRMFSIHYLTQLEFPYKSYNPVLADVNEVTLLHYKISPILTGDIWGQQNIERNWREKTRECLDFKSSGGYKEDLETGHYCSPDNQLPRKCFIQNIDISLRKTLQVKYLSRMSGRKF